MPVYVVTRKADGAEVYRYQHIEPVAWIGMEFATHDHTEIAEPPAAPAPLSTVYGGRRELTPLEFLRLLTQPERVAIRTAAKQNATIEDYLDLIDKADTVNLDNDDVSGGLTLLEQAGLLASGRAEEILNG